MTTIRNCTVLLMLVVLCAGVSTEVAARQRRGDRFGLRGGIWPQSAVKGNLGEFYATFGENPDPDTVVARFDEPSAIVPFIELYGVFHLRGMWSIEAAIGYSMRKDVEVADDTLRLGSGRIDFFPLFAGLRGEFPIGSGTRRHNAYIRGGASLIFASESPSGMHPVLNRIYSPGSEGAPGFVIGGGVEYYFAPRNAVTFDLQFRHAWFSFARNAKFNQYGIWVSTGILVSTR